MLAMRAKKFFILITIGLFFLVPGASMVNAQEETCNCYCTSVDGAKYEPDANTKITRDDCQSRCAKKGESIAAFACNANQHPTRTLTCFNKTQCDDVGGKLSDYQPPECASKFHYCFPDPTKAAKVTLSTSINGLTITGDLGEYIGTAYKWMLGTGTTIAIVFVMIAGLRWSLGGVSAEQIGAAKKTIINAVIGVVLLLFTVLLLATVNPYLINLKVPSFPMLKTVSLVGNASCDTLKAEGYELDFGKKDEVCGTVATVVKDPKGGEVPDGTVCNFSKCPSSDQVCVPGATPVCRTCEQLTAKNTDVVVTSSICSAFNELGLYQPIRAPVKGKTLANGQVMLTSEIKFYQQCFFTHDPDAGGVVGGPGACARVSFDCSAITSCETYDGIVVHTGGKTPPLDKFDVGVGSGLSGSAGSLVAAQGEFTLGSFCSNSAYADMCRWNRQKENSGKDPGTCYIDATQIGAVFAGTVAGDLLNSFTTVEYDCQTINADVEPERFVD
jgi:hypothetical protein